MNYAKKIFALSLIVSTQTTFAAFYAGFQMGYNIFSGNRQESLDDQNLFLQRNNPVALLDKNLKSSAPTLGLCTGFRKVVKNFIFDIEPFLNVDSFKKSEFATTAVPISANNTINLFSVSEFKKLLSTGLNLHAGYQFGKNITAYALCGFQIARFQYSAQQSLRGFTNNLITSVDFLSRSSKYLSGLSLGAGFEFVYKKLRFVPEFVYTKFSKFQDKLACSPTVSTNTDFPDFNKVNIKPSEFKVALKVLMSI